MVRIKLYSVRDRAVRHDDIYIYISSGEIKTSIVSFYSISFISLYHRSHSLQQYYSSFARHSVVFCSLWMQMAKARQRHHRETWRGESSVSGVGRASSSFLKKRL